MRGSIVGNIEPAVSGMLQTLGAKCSANNLATKLLEIKPAVTKIVNESVLSKHCKQFEESEDNLLRSMHVYYCSNVLGKNKYISTRIANKENNVPNFVPYIKLAEK